MLLIILEEEIFSEIFKKSQRSKQEKTVADTL